MTTTEPPAGINYPNVSRFFAEHVPGGNVPLTFTLIGDGRSNLTYLVTGGGQRWVLRRPPLGHVLPTAHDMAREYKVISALATTNVPVPKAIAFCDDTSVNDYPFYVMGYSDGVIVVSDFPEGFVTTPEERRKVSLALVRTLADLHAVDYRAVGLSEFGRPDGYLERQLARWIKQWEASKTRELPAIDELIRRLRASMPESGPSTIVHGDYRLGNMALDPDDPGRVTAIFDWEMSTLGDPLADLGYTLMYWGDPGDPPEMSTARPSATITLAEGFLRRAELAAEYERLTGRSVEHVAWYQVFAFYKLAVILEGIHNRYLQGKTVGEGFETMGQSVVNLVTAGLRVADDSGVPGLNGA